MTLAWALRLALFITWRNWGHGEDRRYAAMRQRHGPGFARRSLTLVFGLQALLAWIVATPLLVAAGGSEASRLGALSPLGPLDLFGLALALGGLVTEAVADAQMARFRRDPALYGRARGDVMDAGLWRYSRHPNYFCEISQWWVFYAMACAVSGTWINWTIIGALLLTLLFDGSTRFTETITRKKYPSYADYQRTTSRLIPLPPRT